MKYKISDAFLFVNGEQIRIGTVLGQEDNPKSPFQSEIITNSEYESGLKSFKYGSQQIDDLCWHIVGTFKDFHATHHVDEKWINELAMMGYDTSKLVNIDSE